MQINLFTPVYEFSVLGYNKIDHQNPMFSHGRLIQTSIKICIQLAFKLSGVKKINEIRNADFIFLHVNPVAIHQSLLGTNLLVETLEEWWSL